MQTRHLVIRIALAAAIGLALAPPAARAQGNPSADQIINSLKPGAGMLGGTRGIRPVGPSSAEPPPAATAGTTHAATPDAARPNRTARTAPAPAAAPSGPPSVNLTVDFASNSATLTPAATRTLSELGRALSSATLASYRFRIEGHTDTVGTPDANKALSERRAQAVVDFLADRFQIDRSRLEPEGMGQDGLLVQTPPQTPEMRNRRVQIVNLGA